MWMARNLSSQRAVFACEMHSIPLFGSYRNYPFARQPWFVATAKSSSVQWRSFLFSPKPNTTYMKSVTQHTELNLFYSKEFPAKQPLLRPCLCNTSCNNNEQVCSDTILLTPCYWVTGTWGTIAGFKVALHQSSQKNLAKHKVKVKDWHSGAVTQSSVLFI